MVSFVVASGIVSIGDGAVTTILSTLSAFASESEVRGETVCFAQGVAGLVRLIGPSQCITCSR